MHPGAECHRYLGPVAKISAMKDEWIGILPGVKTGRGEPGDVSQRQKASLPEEVRRAVGLHNASQEQ